ncbi:MAG: hypothetical protein ACRDQ4_25670 [Pseudonocardiaceae bacterium]
MTEKDQPHQPEGRHSLTHQQQQQTPHLPDGSTAPQRAPDHQPDTIAAPTDIDPDPQPPTQPLATYIRHIVETAPPPTPAQLERLAGLLRDTSSPSS